MSQSQSRDAAVQLAYATRVGAMVVYGRAARAVLTARAGGFGDEAL